MAVRVPLHRRRAQRRLQERFVQCRARRDPQRRAVGTRDEGVARPVVVVASADGFRTRARARARSPRTESSVRSPRGGPFLDLLDRSRFFAPPLDWYPSPRAETRAKTRPLRHTRALRAIRRDRQRNRRRGRRDGGETSRDDATIRASPRRCLYLTPRVPPPLGAPEPPALLTLFSRRARRVSAPVSLAGPLPGPRRPSPCRSASATNASYDAPSPTSSANTALAQSRAHRRLLPPPSLSSRSSRGVTSAPRHARSSRRAARRSARRRACSSSGPSARDDRGAADQGASRALGVAACAAELGDTAEVDAAPPRAATPSCHARRSMFGKDTSKCVRAKHRKWSVDRFNCPNDQWEIENSES